MRTSEIAKEQFIKVFFILTRNFHVRRNIHVATTYHTFYCVSKLQKNRKYIYALVPCSLIVKQISGEELKENLTGFVDWKIYLRYLEVKDRLQAL